MVLLAFACVAQETVLGNQQAPGSCPYCGGTVVATVVESRRGFCCLPVCVKIMRRYSCAACSRRLVLYP
ncbi:unnamed protein product [Spirodela intermedia]|uniref:Uncharacterized protein n=2 Tax=Spirodela intermedia TaxID=51605 RepID=A0A7I8J4S3_SPIIN|nr:unnamed protein product [Spirodela intermedia]CAA6665044.1 unnamed protein product [Spirodela intermedia]CAA7401688.1 unnamed protein product [Spirodela intermedia]